MEDIEYKFWIVRVWGGKGCLCILYFVMLLNMFDNIMDINMVGF